jgi:hypothetical protein
MWVAVVQQQNLYLMSGPHANELQVYLKIACEAVPPSQSWASMNLLVDGTHLAL